jgi:hypothetical protein
MKILIAVGVVCLLAGTALLVSASYLLAGLLVGAGVLVLTVVPFVGVLGTARNARFLQANGIAASAEILGLSQTGTYINEQPMVGFTLRVMAPGREVITLDHQQVVPHVALGSIAPGRLVGVLVDPQNPATLVIDWGSIAPNRISLDGGPEVDLGQYPGAAIALRQLIASSGRAAHGTVDLRSDPELKTRARAILAEHGVRLDAPAPPVAPGPPVPGGYPPSPAPSAPAAPAPAARDKDSVAERLQELDQLRSAGLVGPEEYDEQRRRILGGL